MAPLASSHSGDLDKTEMATISQREDIIVDDTAESHPDIHVHTILAITAMAFIYVGQMVSLVGAGAQGHAIAGHFGNSGDSVWFSAAITIFTVVLGPIISQAADYFGRKWLLVIPTAAGSVGSIIVARADSINMAIGGFCVIGIAFGAQPLVHTVTSEVLPRRWRGYAQAIDMASVAVGSVCGLLAGGAFNRTGNPASNGFRNCYYMATAWFAVASILCAYTYNPSRTKQQAELASYSVMGKLRMLDWVGYFLLASGLVLFSVGLSWSNNPYPWSHPRVAATFVIGLGLAACLVIYATWVKKDGMFHHGLFTTHRNFTLALFCIFSEGAAFFAANSYFAFQIGVLYEPDALLVGTRYSIMFITSIVGGIIAGTYCAFTRKFRWITVLAFLLFLAFFACMAASNRRTNHVTWGYMVLQGLALGLTLTTLIVIGQLCTPPALISTASGLIISIRSLGGTVGLAVYQAIFTKQMNHLPDLVADAVVPRGLVASQVGNLIQAIASRSAERMEKIPGISEDIINAGTEAYENAYVLGFRYVWVAAGCFVAVAMIAAVFVIDTKHEFNMHIDAPIEEGDQE